MAIERSYLEAHSIIDGLLKHVFRRSILANHQAELDFVKRQLLQETVTFNFHDGISLWKEDGWMEDEEGWSAVGSAGLSTDYYILGASTSASYIESKLILSTDKFPLDVRPFHTT